MTTVLRDPAPALAPFVEALWYVEDDLSPGRERKLPSGEMQIVVNLAQDALRWYDGAHLDQQRTTHGAGLCGVLAGPIGIDTAEQQRVLGVSFRPGGTLPFFLDPATELTEPVIGLDALWGRAGSTLRARLLEQTSPAGMLQEMETVLEERVVRPLDPDPELVAAAVTLGRGVPSVLWWRRSAPRGRRSLAGPACFGVIGGDSGHPVAAITSNDAISARLPPATCTSRSD